MRDLVYDAARMPPCLMPSSRAGPRLLWAQSAHGVDRGALIHVSAAAGGATDLVCPDCRQRVTPVKGARKAHHFRHLLATACLRAGETAAHRLAKEIIARERRLWIPPLVVRGLDSSETVSQGGWIEIEAVRIEPARDGFRPDLIVTRHGVELMVEIVVCHDLDEAKVRRIEASGASALAIRLGAARHAEGADLANAVMKDAPREWIYNRVGASREAELKKRDSVRRRRLVERACHAWRSAPDPRWTRNHDAEARAIFRRLARLDCAQAIATSGEWAPIWRGAADVAQLVAFHRLVLSPLDAAEAFAAGNQGFASRTATPSIVTRDALRALRTREFFRPDLAAYLGAVEEDLARSEPELLSAFAGLRKWLDALARDGVLATFWDTATGVEAFEPSRGLLAAMARDAAHCGAIVRLARILEGLGAPLHFDGAPLSTRLVASDLIDEALRREGPGRTRTLLDGLARGPADAGALERIMLLDASEALRGLGAARKVLSLLHPGPPRA